MPEIVLSQTLKFRTREFCVYHFSNMLSSYEIGNKISERDAEDLLALVEFHADFSRLIGPGIAYFMKCQTSKMGRFGEFVIVRADNTSVAFSHRNAAMGQEYKPKPKVKNRSFLCHPIGLPHDVVWISEFCMHDG